MSSSLNKIHGRFQFRRIGGHQKTTSVLIHNTIKLWCVNNSKGVTQTNAHKALKLCQMIRSAWCPKKTSYFWMRFFWLLFSSFNVGKHKCSMVNNGCIYGTRQMLNQNLGNPVAVESHVWNLSTLSENSSMEYVLTVSRLGALSSEHGWQYSSHTLREHPLALPHCVC